MIVCQWFATGLWFSPVSSTNKTDRHDIQCNWNIVESGVQTNKQMQGYIMQCTRYVGDFNQGNWQTPYADINSLKVHILLKQYGIVGNIIDLSRLWSTHVINDWILNLSRIYAYLLNIDHTTRKKGNVKIIFLSQNCVE